MDHPPDSFVPPPAGSRCDAPAWSCECWFAWAAKKEKKEGPPPKPVLRPTGTGALGHALKKHIEGDEPEEKPSKKNRDKPSRFGSRRR